MRSSRRAVVTLFWLFAVAVLSPARAGAQGYYSYEGVADSRPASRFENFGNPSINDAGDIAFAAYLKSGGSGIYKWSAATRSMVTISEDPSTSELANAALALDPFGNVIFQHDPYAIYVGDGVLPAHVLVDSSLTVPLAASPGPFPCEQPRLRSRSTDASGKAAVSCLVSDGIGLTGEGVYLTDGGALERVCDLVSFGVNSFDRCFYDGFIEVSSAGVVAGIGLDPSRLDEFGYPRQLLVRGTVAGLDVLLDPGVHSALAFPNRLNRLGINVHGTITYEAYLEAGSASGYAIFRIDSVGAPVLVTDPRNFVYRGANTPSINSVGEIPFTDANLRGLYIGPDPALNKVMGQGDAIPGYAIPGLVTSVADVSFQHPGINTLGELTFIALLGDGTLVIARALPPNNHAPVVTVGDQSSPEGSPATARVIASDQDGDYPLVYGLEPDATPPVGAVQPPLPLPVSIDSNGDITGTFAPGTAGNVYAFTVTVSDSRQRSTSVDVTWTVTQELPPSRLNVRATANTAAQGIDVTWENPSPDTANEVLILYSTSGPGGPFLAWGYEAVSAPGVLFLDPPFGSGVNYCFSVKAAITQGSSHLLSVDSNIACANYPRFSISDALSRIETTDSVFFRVTTTMPAELALDPQTQLPQGALSRVTVIDPHTFDVTIWNLPVQATPTPYAIGLVAYSDPVGLVASRAISVTTRAESPGGGGAGNSQPHNAPDLRLTRIGDLQEGGGTSMFVDVELSNRSGSPQALNLRLRPETNVEWRCPPISGLCSSETVVSSMLVLPDPIPALGPGESRIVRLYFEFPRELVLTTGGTAHLHGVIDYEFSEGGGAASGTARPEVSLFLPLGNVNPAAVGVDLAVTSLVVSRGGAAGLDIRVTFRVANLGAESARGVSVTAVLPAHVLLASNVSAVFTSPLPAGVSCRAQGLGGVQGPDGIWVHPPGAPTLVSCSIARLDAGARKAIEFDARGDSPADGELVVVTVGGAGIGDTDPGNDSASESVPPL